MPKTLPRRPREKPNGKQERFAIEYVADCDKVRAVRAAGYAAKDDETARAAAGRLLRNPTVQAVIEREKLRIIERTGNTAEKTVLRLLLVYSEAMQVKDFSAAVSALDKIAKFHGLYEKHQVQKRYTQEDVEKLKAELKAVGFSFERVNFPGSN